MIFLVTKGEYSDFGVVTAFSKQEDAERAVADGLGDAWEECSLDVQYPPLPAGLSLWRVCFGWSKGTNPDYCYASQYENYEPDGDGFKLTPARAIRDGERVEVQCWARDKEHALKIASEQRAQFVASQGVTRPLGH